MNEVEHVETEAAEMAAEMALPRDYDAYYGVEGINREIMTLLQQVIAAKDEERNALIAELQDEHRQKLDAMTVASSELRERAEIAEAEQLALQNRLKEAEQAAAEQASENGDLRAELQEALMKRDNAVRLMEEAQAAQKKAEGEAQRLRAENESLKSQINELEGMIRTLKSTNRPATIGGLKLTSTLPDISDEELKARKERERIEGINKLLERRGIPPLELPPLPSAEKAPESDDEPVTDEALAEQMQRVDEAAEADRATFPVVHTDAGADTAEAGAGETVADAAEADRTPSSEELMTAFEQRMTALDCRVSELESWRKQVDYFRNNGRWPA